MLCPGLVEAHIDTAHHPEISDSDIPPPPSTSFFSQVGGRRKVYRVVLGILNKLTPENFERLLGHMLEAGIDSADILAGVTKLVFEKAITEPGYCALYTELCAQLRCSLPVFSTEENGATPITFRRVLLGLCQDEFEGTTNARADLYTRTFASTEAYDMEERKVRPDGGSWTVGEGGGRGCNLGAPAVPACPPSLWEGLRTFWGWFSACGWGATVFVPPRCAPGGLRRCPFLLPAPDGPPRTCLTTPPLRPPPPPPPLPPPRSACAPWATSAWWASFSRSTSCPKRS